MKLYIGNATSQNWNFHYRLPERKSPINQFIPMGEQVVISGDLNKFQVDAIIEQGSQYGLVSVDEIDRGDRMYRGLCYSIDKEISSSKIEKLFHRNSNVLALQGQEIRRNAAIVENNRLLRQNQEMDLPNIRKTEITLQEENKPDSGTKIAEGYVAEFDGGARPGGRRRARS